ncbi:MAG: hypothetical protein ACOYNL_02655 [Rickettsiales bacterium]
MEFRAPLIASLLMLGALTACGGTDKETTVVYEQPVVIEHVHPSGTTTNDVEARCKNGYDNRSHSCY